MNRVPLVSVLIVSRDAGAYLDAAVASVLAQSYPNREIVLVDNASADGSVDRVAAACAGRGDFHLVRAGTNLGPAGGACLGLPACGGAYIARLDADDLARPDRLARQVALLESRPDLVAAGSDALCIDPTGQPLHPRLALRTAFLRRHGSRWISACPHSSLLFRRSAAANRFYNPTLFGVEDLEWIEWLARDGRLGLVPEPLVYYRLHEDSLSAARAGFHRLAGAEVRLRLSAVRTDQERRELAARDFSALREDPRSDLGPAARSRLFFALARTENNALAAAYFATISGRWAWFPWYLLRALVAGHAIRTVLGLLLIRTLWPLWKRTSGLFFRPPPTARPREIPTAKNPP
jgi:glycosyltransferase involved in cell wall biosynthesis